MKDELQKELNQQNKMINIKFLQMLTIGLGLLTIAILGMILSNQTMSALGISLSAIGIFFFGKELLKMIISFIQVKRVLKVIKKSIHQIDK